MEEEPPSLSPSRSIGQPHGRYEEVVYEVKVNVLGMAGITADRSNCSQESKDSTKAPAPERMAAVATFLCDSQIRAISSPSRPLKRSPADEVVMTGGSGTNGIAPGLERHIALWENEDSNPNASSVYLEAKLKRAVCSNPAVAAAYARMSRQNFSIVVGLIDTKDDGDGLAYSIGETEVTISAEKANKILTLDLPIQKAAPGSFVASPSKKVSVDSLTPKRKNRLGKLFHKKDSKDAAEAKELAEIQCSFSSAYAVDPHGDAVIRVEIEVKEKDINYEVDIADVESGALALPPSMNRIAQSVIESELGPPLSLNDCSPSFDEAGPPRILSPTKSRSVTSTVDTSLGGSSSTKVLIPGVHIEPTLPSIERALTSETVYSDEARVIIETNQVDESSAKLVSQNDPDDEGGDGSTTTGGEPGVEMTASVYAASKPRDEKPFVPPSEAVIPNKESKALPATPTRIKTLRLAQRHKSHKVEEKPKPKLSPRRAAREKSRRLAARHKVTPPASTPKDKTTVVRKILKKSAAASTEAKAKNIGSDFGRSRAVESRKQKPNEKNASPALSNQVQHNTSVSDAKAVTIQKNAHKLPPTEAPAVVSPEPSRDRMPGAKVTPELNEDRISRPTVTPEPTKDITSIPHPLSDDESFPEAEHDAEMLSMMEEPQQGRSSPADTGNSTTRFSERKGVVSPGQEDIMDVISCGQQPAAGQLFDSAWEHFDDVDDGETFGTWSNSAEETGDPFMAGFCGPESSEGDSGGGLFGFGVCNSSPVKSNMKRKSIWKSRLAGIKEGSLVDEADAVLGENNDDGESDDDTAVTPSRELTGNEQAEDDANAKGTSTPESAYKISLAADPVSEEKKSDDVTSEAKNIERFHPDEKPAKSSTDEVSPRGVDKFKEQRSFRDQIVDVLTCRTAMDDSSLKERVPNVLVKHNDEVSLGDLTATTHEKQVDSEAHRSRVQKARVLLDRLRSERSEQLGGLFRCGYPFAESQSVLSASTMDDSLRADPDDLILESEESNSRLADSQLGLASI